MHPRRAGLPGAGPHVGAVSGTPRRWPGVQPCAWLLPALRLPSCACVRIAGPGWVPTVPAALHGRLHASRCCAPACKALLVFPRLLLQQGDCCVQGGLPLPQLLPVRVHPGAAGCLPACLPALVLRFDAPTVQALQRRCVPLPPPPPQAMEGYGLRSPAGHPTPALPRAGVCSEHQQRRSGEGEGAVMDVAAAAPPVGGRPPLAPSHPCFICLCSPLPRCQSLSSIDFIYLSSIFIIPSDIRYSVLQC